MISFLPETLPNGKLGEVESTQIMSIRAYCYIIFQKDSLASEKPSNGLIFWEEFFKIFKLGILGQQLRMGPYFGPKL